MAQSAASEQTELPSTIENLFRGAKLASQRRTRHMPLKTLFATFGSPFPAMWWCELLALHALALLQCVVACPTECHCIGQARVSVHCDFRGLEEVPINIPVTTAHLDLSGNKFTNVVPQMFLGYVNDSEGVFTQRTAPLTQLKTLHLDLNPLLVVNEHAFKTTPSLELIYLPFDVKIQRQAFAEMKTDKTTFDGYDRVGNHPLEDPHFVAFTRSAA